MKLAIIYKNKVIDEGRFVVYGHYNMTIYDIESKEDIGQLSVNPYAFDSIAILKFNREISEYDQNDIIKIFESIISRPNYSKLYYEISDDHDENSKLIIQHAINHFIKLGILKKVSENTYNVSRDKTNYIDFDTIEFSTAIAAIKNNPSLINNGVIDSISNHLITSSETALIISSMDILLDIHKKFFNNTNWPELESFLLKNLTAMNWGHTQPELINKAIKYLYQINANWKYGCNLIANCLEQEAEQILEDFTDAQSPSTLLRMPILYDLALMSKTIMGSCMMIISTYLSKCVEVCTTSRKDPLNDIAAFINIASGKDIYNTTNESIAWAKTICGVTYGEIFGRFAKVVNERTINKMLPKNIAAGLEENNGIENGPEYQ